ncbi:hypothetical protein MTO96_049870 [Rhipicephalus appendiculatus]
MQQREPTRRTHGLAKLFATTTTTGTKARWANKQRPGSSETAADNGESAPEPKPDEPKGSKEPHPGKPTTVSTLVNFPHAQTSTDGVPATKPGNEEHPARASQARRAAP